MTSKIEVPRELLSGYLVSVTGYDDSRLRNELIALLAAPEAPRQEPVAWRCTGDIGTPHVTDSEDCASAWYSHGGHVDALYADPLSPDHSGGGAGVVLPSEKEIRELKTKAARQADLTSGSNYYTAAEFAADAMLDKVKELNQ